MRQMIAAATVADANHTNLSKDERSTLLSVFQVKGFSPTFSPMVVFREHLITTCEAPGNHGRTL